jgi:lipoyl(octanoyl) transferase
MDPLECEGYQLKLAEGLKGTRNIRVLFVSHQPCITLGRHTPKNEVLLQPPEGNKPEAIRVFRLKRGGGATYHGPGQMIAYILADLELWRVSVPSYIRILEEAMLSLLGYLGVEAKRVPSRPGVYLEGGKVGFVGIGLHHGVSLHGISLNVGPGVIEGFRSIVPCGMPGLPVAQIFDKLEAPDVQRLIPAFLEGFVKAWERQEC